MTLLQSALVALAAAIAIVAGVGMLWGLPWALIAAGVLGLASVVVFYDADPLPKSRNGPRTRG